MTKRYMLIPIASFLLNFSILTAQNWTEMSDPVRPYVTRLTDGNGLSCGLATQEEMVSIREAIDRMSPKTPPSEKYALAPPAANISVNYTGFTPEAQAAFQRAVDIWSSLLITTVPIERHRQRQARRLSAPDRPGPRGPKDVFRWRRWSVRIDHFFRDVCGGARLPARNGTAGEKLWMTRKKT